MFDIITTQYDNSAVKEAVETVAMGKQGIIEANGSYRLTVEGRRHATEGDGGASRRVLVIVGHGSANGLSGCRTWAEYKIIFGNLIEWSEKDTVYLVSCRGADESFEALGFGNISREVAKDFPDATVWASSTPVFVTTLQGTWEKVQ